MLAISSETRKPTFKNAFPFTSRWKTSSINVNKGLWKNETSHIAEKDYYRTDCLRMKII